MPTHKRFSVLLAMGWVDSRLASGVATFARDAGWHVSTEAIYGASLPWGWQGDGCIATVHGADMCRFVQSLDVPVVDCARQREAELEITRVHEDDRAIGRRAAKHLLELGFKRFAFYRSDNSNVSQDRCTAFNEAVCEQGWPCVELYRLEHARTKKQNVWREQRAWLAEQLAAIDKPTAIFCVDDRLALSISEVASDLGIQIPQQLAVMGVGNLAFACECSHVPITSVDIDYEAMGYHAAEMLDGLMRGETPPAKPTLFPHGEVVIRKSTETLAADDPLCAEAVRYMFENYHRDIGVEDIVRGVGLDSRRKLNYAVKQSFGVGPGRILEQIRMKAATRLLEQGKQTIERVAFEVGFGSALRFRRIFHRWHGTSPGRYRQQARAEASADR